MKALFSFMQQVHTSEAPTIELLQTEMHDAIDETLNDVATSNTAYESQMQLLENLGPIAFLLQTGSTVTIVP